MIRKTRLYYQLAEVLAFAELATELRLPLTHPIHQHISLRCNRIRKQIGKNYDVMKYIKVAKDL